MSSWAGRLCAIAACLLLVSCGRIGVFPIAEGLDPLDEPESGSEPPDEREAGGTREPEASTPDAGDGPRPTEPLDAAITDGGAVQPDAMEAAVLEASLDAQASMDADEAGSDAQEAAAQPQDAGAEADVPDVSVTACHGARVLDLCWYLGGEDESCRDVCASHGGYDARTASAVGSPSQGGNLESCRSVLAAFGYSGVVGEGMRPDGLGLGCHRWDPDAWWIAAGNGVDPEAHATFARIACACAR